MEKIKSFTDLIAWKEGYIRESIQILNTRY